MKRLFLLLTTTLISFCSYSQVQHIVDSLETALKNHNALKLELRLNYPSLYDTTAADILNFLSGEYWNSNLDKAMNYANQCLALSEQIGYTKGIGKAYNSMGIIHYQKGSYSTGLEFHNKALRIREDMKDLKGIAASYNNLGINYNLMGNYPEALKNYLAALTINEESGNLLWQAYNLNNIGNVYYKQGKYTEALKNYFASLRLYGELGNRDAIADTYSNIGVIYQKQGKYPEALKNQLAALKTAEELGDKRGIADSYHSIGNIYEDQGKYPLALKNYFVSLKINEEIGNKDGIAYCYINIGSSYMKETKYQEAFEYLNNALLVSNEIGGLERIKESYNHLATLYSATGNFSKALEHYKLYITYRDSIENTENSIKTVALQMNFDFGKKQDSLYLVQANKDMLTQKEVQKQKFIRNGFVGGFAVVLLFAGVFFKQRNKTQKERRRSENLLLNILPGEVAEEIKITGTAKAKAFTMVTVMFTDFKDFTTVSEKISAELLVDEIHTCFSAFDHILQKYKIEKIKTIGDAYLCASGLPVSTYTHADDMLNAAFEIRSYILQRKKEKEARGEIPFEMRIGIHTGPVVAGIVGVIKYAYDIWGDTVNIAARMEQNSEVGKINISGSTYELVKDKFSCTHRGKIQAKNKGEIDMYFVENIPWRE